MFSPVRHAAGRAPREPESAVAFNDRGPCARLLGALAPLWRDPSAAAGLILFGTLVVVAVFANVIAPYDPTAVHVPDRLQLPSRVYLLGTDELGRDVLSRLIFGARSSIAVGLVSVLIAGVIGIPIGAAGGYRGKLLDAVVMRVMDGLLAFPGLILALAIVTALGPSLADAMIAIGVVGIPGFARITRGVVLSLKEQEFVEASRAIGATDAHVIFRILLPNCVSPLTVKASIAFAGAILTEAALSFLGLGVQPPAPSWGAMLDDGRKYLDQTPWYSIAAGAAIFVAVLSLNLLGDGLRDALDPRLGRVS